VVQGTEENAVGSVGQRGEDLEWGTAPASIVEAFSRRAQRAPEKPCLRCEAGWWTYGGLVEGVLEGCPGVAEVVGLPDQEFGERVTAVVVPGDPGLSAENIEDFCREELASYKKPRQIIFVDALPRNALGKVLKYRVRERLIEAEG